MGLLHFFFFCRLSCVCIGLHRQILGVYNSLPPSLGFTFRVLGFGGGFTYCLQTLEAKAVAAKGGSDGAIQVVEDYKIAALTFFR